MVTEVTKRGQGKEEKMSARIIRFAAIVALSVPGLLAAAVLPSRAQSLVELYDKAKAEGSLVLFVGGPTAPWEARAKQFEQRYPGIKISITGGFSNVLDKQIDQQLKDNKLAVDTAIFQTLDDFVRWKAQGQLLPFKPDGFDAIDASFKDDDGAFLGVMIIAMPYQFNTQLVKSEDVPKSALDFLKPIFRGKVVAAYPADDDATLYLFHSIVQKYGWDYMDKYMANQPNFIQGHLSVQRSISSGQNLVTPDSIFSITEAEKRAGKPVDSHFSSIDPTPIWPLTGAVFKNAPHPNAGRLFLAWLLEKDQQAKVGTWSVRADVPPPTGYKPIFSYPVVNDYRGFLTNAGQIADLRKRFEAYTGPVVNTGGVR
jgi:ABC-type Fe3+ transport system substrate-binding protein